MCVACRRPTINRRFFCSGSNHVSLQGADRRSVPPGLAEILAHIAATKFGDERGQRTGKLGLRRPRPARTDGRGTDLPETTTRSNLLGVLIYAALTSAVVSSLGMLLVPTISDELDVDVSAAQWMLTINLLVGGIATPIMGRLSDGPHKKRLLLCSLLTILFGSVVAAAAPNFTVFLIGRALQGLSYGIVPVTIALARRYLAEKEIQFGISSLSVTVTTGLGVGYPLTGILADLFGFRFAFWFAALFLTTTAWWSGGSFPGARTSGHRADASTCRGRS